jgi:ATP-dependent helicase/nuclease subunit B
MNIALNDAAEGADVLDNRAAPDAGWANMPAQAWNWTPGLGARQAWLAWSTQVHDWMTEQGVVVRDAVVLLPQVALLHHARQAWSDAVGGWLPRFETVGTLLERLPPQAGGMSTAPALLTLDVPLDRLLVGSRLAAEPGGKRWRTTDRGAFDFGVEQVVNVAHAWIKGLLSQAPAHRDEWAQASLAGVASSQGAIRLDEVLTHPDAEDAPLDAQASRLRAGRMEQWLLDQALAMASLSWPSLAQRRDALFDARASAWVAVTAGVDVVPGTDSALMLSLLGWGQTQGLPVCWTPAVLDTVAGAPLPADRPAIFEADHTAHEAEAAACLVLDAVARVRAAGGGDPVALIAQDRVLTRRIRALLAPQERAGQLVMADESGWTLSTTRAAATVTRLLAAAHPQASSDDWLDWLVEGWCENVPGGLAAVGALEAVLRRQGRLSTHGLLESLPADNPAALALRWAQDTLAPMQSLSNGRHFALGQGLITLGQVLAACGALAPLQEDPAGQAVLKALRLEVDALGDVHTQAIWSRLSSQVSMGFGEWVAWVDQTLEGANFMPPSPGEQPDVVITPLTRAVLRPFEAVIMPGADERQLGRAPGGQWLSSAQMAKLGLGTMDQQQASQWGAWAVLCCHPRMMALSRHLRDGEPVAPSPWLSRWLHELGAPPGQDAWRTLPDPRPLASIEGQGVLMAAPALPMLDGPTQGGLAPLRISATAYEQLRACPYRYFARSLLGLSSLDELDEGLEASETGTWLHQVLKAFHDERAELTSSPTVDEDVARFIAVAQVQAQASGLSSEERKAYFGPWLVTLPRLALYYVTWLHSAEAQGWQVQDQEKRLERTVALTDVDGQPVVAFYGVLDRIDRQTSEQGLAWRVMDYKTGSLSGLTQRVKAPQEDTQLAFYAALADAAAPESARLSATYLRVADDEVKALEHPDAELSARLLVQGVTKDMSRIWQGHAMPALGEGPVCDYCEVRGLCRKDHWAADADQLMDQEGA